MNEDPLKKSDGLGINAQVYAALLRGDLETVIWTMLLGQNADPRLATLMDLMHGQNDAEAAGPRGSRKPSDSWGRTRIPASPR